MFPLPILVGALLGVSADPDPPPLEAAPPPRAVELTTALAVRELPPETAARKLPVRIVGTVTSSNPATTSLFVQDDTAGVHVLPSPFGADLLPGDRVEVIGETDPGGFAPVIRAERVALLGSGPMPEPVPFDFDRDESRWLDGYYVQAWAVVRSVRGEKGYAVLSVYTASGRGEVWVVGQESLPAAQKLVDAAVRIRGVCVAGFRNRLVVDDPKVYTRSLPAAVPGAAGKADVTMTPTQVAELPNRFHPSPHPGARRVCAVGVVSSVLSDREFTIQDDRTGLTVAADTPTAVKIGDKVDVVGLLSVSKRRVGVARASVTPLEGGTLPAPVEADSDELFAGRWDGMRVRIAGVVEDVRPFEGGAELTVRVGADHLDVLFPNPAADSLFDAVPVGSRVAVTCVPTANKQDDGSADGLTLIASSPDDLTVLELPPPEPWWTRQRVAALVGSLAGVGALGFLWVGTLRSRVRRQTDQIRRELERSSELEAEYRDLFEVAGDAVWVADADGRFIALNPAAERMFGVSRDAAVGRRVNEFLAPHSANGSLHGGLQKVPDTYEIATRPANDSEVVAEVSCRTLPDGRVQAIARDVTVQRRLRDQTDRVAKLEAVGRLAGGIAHDFNNLLTVVNGGAELIAARVPNEPDLLNLCADVLAAGRRAAALTGQLVAFSRNRVVALTHVDLAREVREAAGLFARLLGEGIELDIALAADLPRIAGDQGLIHQVLLNLAVNARDAMPNGGRFAISTERATDGWVRMRVADTGCGMTPEVKARLFEPFFTTKPVGQGTGLGLAVVHGAVESMGGRIAVASEPGAGAAFEIDFPPAPASAATLHDIAPQASDREVEPTAGRPVVLLVEDDDAVRNLSRHVLDAAGLEVLAAEGGTAGLELAARAVRLDAVVSDVRMPGMSGPEMAERLWATRPGLPVVFVSGHSEDEVLRAGVRADAVDFLGKPFTPGRLADKVWEVLSRPPARG